MEEVESWKVESIRVLRKACSVRVGSRVLSWVVLSWKKTYLGREYRIRVRRARECPGKK